MTLAFLGHLNPDRIPRALSAARRAAARVAAHRLEFSHIGVFPDWKRPRVIWAGAGRGGPELTSVAESLRRELSRSGFHMPEEKFLPHTTLGRVRKGGAAASLRSTVKSWQNPSRWSGAYFDVDSITLYESKLSPDGPAFRVLERVALH